MSVTPINENVTPINQEEYERQKRVKIMNDSIIQKLRFEAALAVMPHICHHLMGGTYELHAKEAYKFVDEILKAGGYLDAPQD